MGFFGWLGKAAGSVGKAIGSNLPVVGGLVSNYIDNKNTDKQNRENREFATMQQDKQNAYNREMWDLNNKYNSPEEQIKRLTAAGINPATLAGSPTGNVASQPVRSADASYQAQKKSAPDLMGSLGLMTNMAVGNAQVNNLRASTDDKLADALLKAIDSLTRDSQNQANLLNTETDTVLKRTSGMLNDAKRFTEDKLRDISADAMREDVRKKRAETNYTNDKNVREAVLQSKNIDEISQRIINMKSLQGIQDADRAIKYMDAQLRANGIGPHDPFYVRMISELATFLRNKATGEKPKDFRDLPRSNYSN